VTGRLLLADDEPDILDPLSYTLRREGFTVECVTDGEAALEAARSASFDLVILDIVMPKLTGTDACRAIRAESDVPIIMLTARDSEVDRVLGLELGADDYVHKPFSSAEFVSRVRAILRRRELDRESAGAAIRELGGLRIDLTRHAITVDGRVVELTRAQFKILMLLADQPERVFSRQQIMEHLWQSPYVGNARACDVHVSNLRQKLERDPGNPCRIVTVRDFGYKLMRA
jgi:DNA-binding response OmpR family regulator